jgi:hypothetical protein
MLDEEELDEDEPKKKMPKVAKVCMIICQFLRI